MNLSQNGSLDTVTVPAFKIEKLEWNNWVYVNSFTEISKIDCLFGHSGFVDFNESIILSKYKYLGLGTILFEKNMLICLEIK